MGHLVSVSTELETPFADESQTVVPSAREHLTQVKPDQAYPWAPEKPTRETELGLARASVQRRRSWNSSSLGHSCYCFNNSPSSTLPFTNMETS